MFGELKNKLGGFIYHFWTYLLENRYLLNVLVVSTPIILCRSPPMQSLIVTIQPGKTKKAANFHQI
jgi:hypothetical protein